MSGTLDDRYFEWLYELVASARNRDPARTHWKLLRQLYTKEFVWLVPNDDNRVEDGKELRYEFLDEQGLDRVDSGWLHLGCSVLEMLIALARRASFEYERKTPDKWFWLLVSNLGLSKFTDAKFTDEVGDIVDDILDRLIYRNYSPSGKGGIFPLQHSAHDQRKVELWYQLAEYLMEEFPP